MKSYRMLDGIYQTNHVTLIHAHFNAFNRSFHLVLAAESRDKTILNDNVKVKLVSATGTKSIHVRENEIEEVYGRLLGEVSNVRGSVVNGRDYVGVIETADEIYYVEPISGHKTNESGTVVYRDIDIERWRIKQRTNQTHHSDPTKPTRTYVSLDWMTHLDPTGWKQTHQRTKRSTAYSPTRRLCRLHVMSDHTFFQYRGSGSVSTTLSLIISHLSQATYIFRLSDFNSDSLGDNVVFIVDEVTIFQTASAVGYTLGSDMNVETLLDKFSMYDFDQYCLGVLFTHRDFADGIIGLAWMGSSSMYGGAGGLCQNRVYYYDPPYYQRGYYSFNSLLISTLNFDQTLPTAVSALTLTHEIGHSFGSPHDSTACSPGGWQGNYIMNAYASDANRPNNFEFSSCSRSYINPVIVNKGSCMDYLSAGVGMCGDGIIDSGEQCDCGDAAQCSLDDQCCHPPGASGCTYTSGNTCSPTISGCCDVTCDISPAATICAEATECSLVSLCDGVSAECPEPVALPNNRTCDNDRAICHDGVCTRNMCLLQGLSQCQCTGFPDTLCQLCCLCNSSCVPAYYLGLRAPSGAIVYHDEGQACNKNRGYCTKGLVCISVDPESALSRLKALFNVKNTTEVALLWFQNYWYLLVIGICLVSLLIALFKAQTMRQKTEPLTTLAMQSGKMSLVWQRANEERKQLKRDGELLEESYHSMVRREHKERPVDYVVAVARMSNFFPTVSRREIVKAIKHSNSEQYAVRQLLLRGFPMKMLLDKNRTNSISEKTSKKEPISEKAQNNEPT